MSLFRYAAEYFPLTLVKTADLDPSKNYIFACHPHGILSQSHFYNFGTEATGFGKLFPGIRSTVVTLSGQFQFPVYRDYILLSGAVESSKASIEWLLTKEGTGNTVAIIIGGVKEVLEAHTNSKTLKLKSRKGFCRLALKHGASIVPVYAFGENELYNQVSNPPGSLLRRWQNFMTTYVGIPPALFHGRGIFNYTFGFVPYRRPVHTVVGAPIDVTKTEELSTEKVDALHEKYCKALTDLFEEHKTKYGLAESDHITFI